MLITCVGKDNNIHTCYPWESTCVCGMPIDKKQSKKFNFSNRYWCYECDNALWEQEQEENNGKESD